MPSALLKACPCGCGTLVEKGRCKASSRQRERWRGTRQERGYDNRWLRRSAAFLRKYPFCGMRPGGRKPVMSKCHNEGLVTPATQTDHVTPHKGDPALFDDLGTNGQALCAACGGRKSQAGL